MDKRIEPENSVVWIPQTTPFLERKRLAGIFERQPERLQQYQQRREIPAAQGNRYVS
jgi:hypothetical protein